MRLSGISKKVIAYICAAALTVTSFTVPTVFAADEAPEAIILDGGEEGGSPMMKTFQILCAAAKTMVDGKRVNVYDEDGIQVYKPSVDTSGYWYGQYASFLDSDVYPGEYKYLQITYTGDITLWRVEFVQMTDGLETGKSKCYWLDPSQDVCLLDVDGNKFTYEDLQTNVGETKTLTIDLEESMYQQDEYYEDYCSGCHMQISVESDQLDKMGHTFTNLNKTYDYIDNLGKPATGIYQLPDYYVLKIVDAKLTREIPEEPTTEEVTTTEEVPTEETTTEEVTEAPTEETTAEEVTEAPTEEPTTEEVTEAPTTVAPTTEAPTEAQGPKDIILDGDEGTHESALMGKVDGFKEEYKYLGWVNFKDIADEPHNKDDETTLWETYRYLIMTYTGDIEYLRFEFQHSYMGDHADQLHRNLLTLWFNPNQANHIVLADGSTPEFDTISNEKKTIVIDLMKCAMGDDTFWWDWYHDGMHVHYGDPTRAMKGFNITSARFSASPEIKDFDKEDHDFVVTPPETTTKKPVVKPTTKAPVKVTKPGKAKVTKISPKKRSAKKMKLTLKKIKGAKGYQVAVYTSSKYAKKNKKAIVKKYVKKYKNITLSSKKLKNKKKLYVKARAYKIKGKRTKVFGAWSKAKRVKIKR